MRQQAKEFHHSREALREVDLEAPEAKAFHDLGGGLVGTDQRRHLEVVAGGERGIDETRVDEPDRQALGARSR